MTQQAPFGTVEHMAWWQVRGEVGEERVLALGEELSQLTGMTLDGSPDVRHYPNAAGQGGVGMQLYFPWVESWLIIGTWPEIGIIRVAMSTCAVERFLPVMVTKYLEAVIGPIEKFGFAEW